MPVPVLGGGVLWREAEQVLVVGHLEAPDAVAGEALDVHHQRVDRPVCLEVGLENEKRARQQNNRRGASASWSPPKKNDDAPEARKTGTPQAEQKACTTTWARTGERAE